MYISIILNQYQFYIRVIQSNKNYLQPGFVCISGSKTSEICSISSQAINSIYYVIFRKKNKTAYSESAVLGFNDKRIVEKLLSGIVFVPIFLNIGNYIVVVSEIENQKFISSILTKK